MALPLRLGARLGVTRSLQRVESPSKPRRLGCRLKPPSGRPARRYPPPPTTSDHRHPLKASL